MSMIDDLLMYLFQSEMLYYVKEITGNIRVKSISKFVIKSKFYIPIIHKYNIREYGVCNELYWHIKSLFVCAKKHKITFGFSVMSIDVK